MLKLNLSVLQETADQEKPRPEEREKKARIAKRQQNTLEGIIGLITVALVAEHIDGFPDKVLTPKRGFSYLRENGVWSIKYDPFPSGIYDLRETNPHVMIRNSASLEKWVLMAMDCADSASVATKILPIFYKFEDGDFSLLPFVLSALPLEVSRAILGYGTSLMKAFTITDVDGFIEAYKQWATGIDLDLDGSTAADDELHKPVSISAAADPDFRFLKALFDLGASPNVVDSTGMTPLFYAISYHSPSYIKQLLEAGAKADLVTPIGNSLHALSMRNYSFPVMNGHSDDSIVEVAKLLIAYGASKSVMSRRHKGRTPVGEFTQEILLNERRPKRKLVIEELVKVLDFLA